MVNWETVYGYVVRGLAEFCGNSIYLSLGCAGAASTDAYINVPLQLGFCFGLMAMIVYNTFWYISGAHIIPSVTLAALIQNKIDWKNALVYIPCQFLGAFFGCYLASLLTPSVGFAHLIENEALCLTIPNKKIGVTNAHAFGIEFLTTSAWVFVMLAIWSRPEESIKDNSAIQVGLAVVTLVMLSVQATGASMSPARSLAPAVIQNKYDSIWIYLTAPLLAGLIIPAVWKYLFFEESLRKWTRCGRKTEAV